MDMKLLLKNLDQLRDKAMRDEVRQILDDPINRLKLLSTFRKNNLRLEDLDDVIRKCDVLDAYVEPTMINARDLVREEIETGEWIIQDFLLNSGVFIFASPPKLGKSTMVRYLAWCISTGTPFLGRPIMQQSPVLWMSCDESKAELKKSFGILDASCGLTGEIEIVHDYIPKNKYLATLERFIQQSHARFVVIDTFVHAFDIEDLNNYAKVEAAVSPFRAKMAQLGVAVMFIFHTNKTNKKGEFEGILGSTAIRSFTAANYTLSGESEKILLKAEGRFICPNTKLTLAIDHNTGIVRERVPLFADTMDEGIMVAQTVDDYRKNQGEWPTKTQLRKALPGQSEGKSGLIDRAVEGGWIVIVPQGKAEIVKTAGKHTA
jgi:RecA-family ATPase